MGSLACPTIDPRLIQKDQLIGSPLSEFYNPMRSQFRVPFSRFFLQLMGISSWTQSKHTTFRLMPVWLKNRLSWPSVNGILKTSWICSQYSWRYASGTARTIAWISWSLTNSTPGWAHPWKAEWKGISSPSFHILPGYHQTDVVLLWLSAGFFQQYRQAPQPLFATFRLHDTKAFAAWISETFSPTFQGYWLRLWAKLVQLKLATSRVLFACVLITEEWFCWVIAGQ